MGDRGQVHIKMPDWDAQTDTRRMEDGEWLYTHWGASNLPTVGAEGLAQGEPRWGDPEYLARIIFERMLEDASSMETGYGIGTERHGDVWRVVEIDTEMKEVIVRDVSAIDMSGETEEVYDFEHFIEDHAPSVEPVGRYS